MMNSVFQLGFKPKYHKGKVNWTQCSLKNLLRSLVVSKIRYLKRLIAYQRLMRNFKKGNTKDLSNITALCRPGPLSKF